MYRPSIESDYECRERNVFPDFLMWFVVRFRECHDQKRVVTHNHELGHQEKVCPTQGLVF